MAGSPPSRFIRATQVCPRLAFPTCKEARPKTARLRCRELFRGKQGPFRDIVLLNAAAAFIVAGRAETLKEGVRLAAASIAEGCAEKALDTLVAASGSHAAEAELSRRKRSNLNCNPGSATAEKA